MITITAGSLAFALIAVASSDPPAACISRETAVACRTEAQLDEFAAAKSSAAARASDSIVAAGDCVHFTKGEVVYIEDEAFFSERRKVRRREDPVAYWVASSAMSDVKNCQAENRASSPETPAQESSGPSRKLYDALDRAASDRAASSQPKGEVPKGVPCEIKPIMTDADIQSCRAAAKSRN